MENNRAALSVPHQKQCVRWGASGSEVPEDFHGTAVLSNGNWPISVGYTQLSCHVQAIMR